MSSSPRSLKHRAWCALGSNQGARSVNLRRAVYELHTSTGIDLARAASIYETPPWGDTFQAPFLNTAIEVRTSLAPEALLERCQEIERLLGRPPRDERKRWGPRPIDIDILLYDDLSIHSAALQAPHPRMAERAFVLLPLREIAPDVTMPDGTRPADALEALRRDAEKCRLIEPLVYEDARAAEALARLGRGEVDVALVRTSSPDFTERAAEALGREMAHGCTLALAGNLGAGKTCLTRGIARGLGIDEPVTSPSYVLVKSYEGRLALHHADFYRLAHTDGDAPEIQSLGLDDYLDDPEAVLVVEWADRFPSWVEPPFLLAHMSGAGDLPRLTLLEGIGADETPAP